MNFQRTNTKISLLEDYYSHFNEDHRLQTRHGQVEFITSLKYIKECLNNDFSKKILDIGAGTGAYSCYLSNEGYDVTAVELVSHNIEVFKKKNSNVKIHQGNALSLDMFEDDSFDVTLLFGPMYHLLDNKDKIKALKEAKRVTKKDGIILVSYYMNEYAILTYGFVKKNILSAKKNNQLDESYHMKNLEGDLYSMVRIEDIDLFNIEASLDRIKIIASDGASNYIRTVLNSLSKEEFDEFITYHLTICERKDLLGASAHLLDILKVNK
jgi:2-polyprenyl-3-methyl-5-hydroxy-6-metoxy-1,4-benzoquinol methylase